MNDGGTTYGWRQVLILRCLAAKALELTFLGAA